MLLVLIRSALLMSTNNIFFVEKQEKFYTETHTYLELCRIKIKTHLGLAKAGLDSGVVLFSSGLNSRILLYFI